MKMMESLPARPLRFPEIEELDGEDLRVAPFSGIPERDLVFAVMFITDERMYGVGFDEDRSEWVMIEQTVLGDSEDEESEAWDLIDTAINEWVENKYGERYGNVVWEV